jgi:hypothetical protein
MPLFIVTMKQVIEHEYRVEAFDEPEAIVLAHEADAKDGGEKWYNLGYDGDVETTVVELSPADIEGMNHWARIASQMIRKAKGEDLG